MLEDGELPPVDDEVGTVAPHRPVPRAEGEPSPDGSARGQRPAPAEASAMDVSGEAPSGDRTERRVPVDSLASPSVEPGAADLPPRDASADAPVVPMPDAATLQAHAHAQVHAPSFMRRQTPRARPRGRRWPWAVALPVLMLMLALQLLLSQRIELAQSARWRPLVLSACGLLGCDVPAWRDPRAFAMLSRGVRPHGTRAGVLHVTTSLRNEAEWAQPLPIVVLSLSDVDGRVLAARAVSPAEYGRRADALVAPGDSVDIAFDVREPSPRVVSFDFQLR
jgi:hypothetical protein